MDRKNWLIIAAVILLAAAALVISMTAHTQTDEDAAIISVDGKEYVRIPLSKPQTVTIRQADGAVNVVTVTEDGVVMQSSTCENQLCVHTGRVTRDNWEFKPNGAFIVCLPNRVSVELAIK